MSSIDGSGRGNLLVSYIFKGDGVTDQIKEELALKQAIGQVLFDRGYKFIIADDQLIDEKLVEKDEEQSLKL
jgi:hypothetical protein